MSGIEFSIRIPLTRKTRFHIKTLLYAVLVFALICGSYKLGERSGIERGFASGWDESMSERLVTEEYPIATKLLSSSNQPSAEMKSVVQKIVTEIDPSSWRENGGPGTIRVYPQSLSLVVHQTGSTHAVIAKRLDEWVAGQ